MRKGTLYFHSACFDGLVSAVLAWVFLETKDWRFQGFIPVNYDVRTMWLSDPLKTPAAIVDFLYHPDADFWADHHPTTFLTSPVRMTSRNGEKRPACCTTQERVHVRACCGSPFIHPYPMLNVI